MESAEPGAAIGLGGYANDKLVISKRKIYEGYKNVTIIYIFVLKFF